MFKINHKTSFILLVILSLFIFSPSALYGEENISIFIDGIPLTFDVEPVITNGRTLVPFRAIFESIDSEVCWEDNTKTAIATKDGVLIKLTIGKNTALVNGKVIALDAPALIINGRTMVPLRFISENLGFDVAWDHDTRTINLSTRAVLLNEIIDINELDFNNLDIGMSLDELRKVFGKEDRIDSSIFNMNWYIYNSDYDNYIQVGVKNNKVVAYYTNSSNWKTAQGISYGSTSNEVNSILGKPETRIKLGNTYIPLENVNKYLYKDLSIWTFKDKFENNKITSIFVIDYALECNLNSLHPNKTNDFKSSTEKQLFDQLNSARKRQGLSILVWDDLVANSALLHSQDMATNNFFSHTNLDNETVGDRIAKQGIVYSRSAENIAATHPNSFFVHTALMNSEGHRNNMLGNFDYIGVGVEISGPLKIYYTQNFYTDR